MLYLELIDSDEDKSKFESLYNSYYKKMWFFAYKILNDEYEAEDAVHNAFIGIAKNIKAIDNVNSKQAKNYCLTAVKNSALNIYYKNKDQNAISLEDIWSASDEAALKDLCEIESTEFITNAISKLPTLYREIIYSYYVECNSYKQLADRYNRKPATIRKQVERGKAMLLKIMIEDKENNYATI